MYAVHQVGAMPYVLYPVRLQEVFQTNISRVINYASLATET